MNGKPSLKAIVTINLINNIPMALVMSISAAALAGQPILTPNMAINIGIAFILACIIAVSFPLQKISGGFAKLFKLDPERFAGRFVGNLPVCLLFVLIIGLLLTLYNVRMVPVFLFAFLDTFLPLYWICFAISMVTNPIAMKVAFGEKPQ